MKALTAYRVAIALVGLYFCMHQALASENTADLYQQGIELYSGADADQHYPAAFELFSRAARSGHGESQYQLGFMYDQGFGVERDYVRALHWYRQAANQHSDRSYPSPSYLGRTHDRIGRLFHRGHGIEQDFERAIYWYSRAIDYGYTESTNPLEQIYLDNYLLQVNANESSSLISQIAASGDATAQYNLGYMHYIGHTVEQNYHTAAMWFLKSATQGDSDSQYQLGKMYRLGQGVQADNKRCYVWSAVSNRLGHAEALKNESGCGQDLDEADLADANAEIAILLQRFRERSDALKRMPALDSN